MYIHRLFLSSLHIFKTLFISDLIIALANKTFHTHLKVIFKIKKSQINQETAGDWLKQLKSLELWLLGEDRNT